MNRLVVLSAMLMNIIECDAVPTLRALKYAAILEISKRELISRSIRRTAGRNGEKVALRNRYCTLQKEAELLFENSVYNYQTARRHSQEGRNVSIRTVSDVD